MARDPQTVEPEPDAVTAPEVDERDAEIARLRAALDAAASREEQRDAELESAQARAAGKAVPNEQGFVPLADLPTFEKQVVMPPHSEHFVEGGQLFCVTCEAQTPEKQRDSQGQGRRVRTTDCPDWVVVQ